MNFQGDNFQSCECAPGSSDELEPSVAGAISVSAVSEIVTCPLLPIADDPSALLSPASSSQ